MAARAVRNVAAIQHAMALHSVSRDAASSSPTPPRFNAPLDSPSQLYGDMALRPWKMPRVHSSRDSSGDIRIPMIITFQVRGTPGRASAGMHRAARMAAAPAFHASEFASNTPAGTLDTKLALYAGSPRDSTVPASHAAVSISAYNPMPAGPRPRANTPRAPHTHPTVPR